MEQSCLYLNGVGKKLYREEVEAMTEKRSLKEGSF
jgi:hypothetical protein